MKFEDCDISINFVDGTMSVDNEAHNIGPFAPVVQETIRAIHWRPKSGAKVPGSIEGADSRGFGLKEFEVFVTPYLESWMAIKEKDDLIAAKAKAEADQRAADNAAFNKQIEVDTARMAEEHKARTEYRAAIVELATTDHEVIKAMELFLANEGRLSPDLVSRRAAARAKAKSEKVRLKI